jgi:hypothetical protein
MFSRDFRASQHLIQTTRKYRSFGAPIFVLALCLATACLGDNHSHAVVFVHATDPHLFVPAAQDSNKGKKASGVRQEDLNQKALTDLFQRVQGLSVDGQAPAFLVLTGDFGVDPCDIPKSQAAPATATTGQSKEPAKLTSKQCIDSFDPAKRSDQIARLSKALGASPLKEMYLVAGNNDVANEDPDSVSLGYFNQFIDDLQKQLNEDKAGVHLYNLTACYAGTGGSSSCYADIANGYRLIGFPSYSFKNEGGKSANNDEQAKQFETFRSLLDQAKQAGKQVLVLSHIPEIDDPYVLAQDRYTAKSPDPADDKDPKNPRSVWSAWNVSVKLLDGWKEILQSDSVAAVLAGHLHDSHKEIYRRPYVWSAVDDHRLGFRKLFLAPPLAVKNQDASPIQARGFSLVTLEPNHIDALLYWYNQETGEFKSDAIGFEHRQREHFSWWRIPRFITWTLRSTWQLDQTDSPLIRLGVMLIALLTAFLTVVAVWNIPETDNPLAPPPTSDKPTNKPSDTQTSQSSTAVSSPFASNFGKTVIGGFTGLAVTEVAKAIGGQALTGDATTASSRWLYIVCFIFFFFFLLVSLSLLRGFVEGLRALVAIPRYSLARPPAPLDREGDPKGDHNKKRTASDYYLFWRFWHWFLSLRVPLLTWFDTFINLIQGKNQSMTKVFSDTIIEQQRNLVQVAHAIRADLTRLIEQKLMYQQRSTATPFTTSPVRVAISVLSADQSTVFYISQSHGSAKMAFIKRSVAWVSVFTGKIRWYERRFTDIPDHDKIVLFDNSKGIIAGAEEKMLLTSCYQPRDQDYEAFVVLPVPWPQRGYGSDYVKGAIHISFRMDKDFEQIWLYRPPRPAISDAGKPEGPPVYPSGEQMLEPMVTPAAIAPGALAAATTPPAPTVPEPDPPGGWCSDSEICVALTNSMAILGELLRNFNEVIYKSYIETNPRD